MKKTQADWPSFFEDPFLSKESSFDPSAPLPVRMRPRTLDEIAGQEHLLAEGKLLRRLYESDRWTSLIFYGPPGTGKTTLARLIASKSKARFIPVNAVSSNVAEMREHLKSAKEAKKKAGQKTILFIDEIHRFNRAQQDILMPEVEEGTVTLIGATTLNPFFVITGPLLSRSTIFELKPLEESQLILLMKRALADKERGLGNYKVEIMDESLHHLAGQASGDSRKALSALELGVLTTAPDSKGIISFDLKVAEESSQRKMVYYDAEGDYHYDTASAFIKSMRGSDPDAALYWLAKMIKAGEDPRFIIRRILILASEDIGNADPQALLLASAGLQAIEFVGMPESQLILSQLVIYMALAPKSNASTLAISKALQDIEEKKTQEVPEHLRDAHYSGAKKMGHGKGYVYSHNVNPLEDTQFFGAANRYYEPKDIGFEAGLLKRLEELIKSRKS